VIGSCVQSPLLLPPDAPSSRGRNTPKIRGTSTKALAEVAAVRSRSEPGLVMEKRDTFGGSDSDSGWSAPWNRRGDAPMHGRGRPLARAYDSSTADPLRHQDGELVSGLVKARSTPPSRTTTTTSRPCIPSPQSTSCGRSAPSHELRGRRDRQPIQGSWPNPGGSVIRHQRAPGLAPWHFQLRPRPHIQDPPVHQRFEPAQPFFLDQR
jgi:hypothetical protein